MAQKLILITWKMKAALKHLFKSNFLKLEADQKTQYVGKLLKLYFFRVRQNFASRRA